MTFMLARFFNIAAAVCYLLAAVLTAVLEHREKKQLVAGIVWLLAATLNATVIINNWIMNGYVPMVSMYQVLTVLSFCFLPIYVYIRWLYNSRWMAKFFAFVSFICMVGVVAMDNGDVWHFPPALQSVWFVPHVLVYMIGYTLCTVSFVLAIVKLIVSRRPVKEGRVSAAEYDEGIYRLICMGFPFITAGMFIGAVWANSVWGGFWAWDIKEVWALITWLLYMSYLHVRRMAPKKTGLQTALAILGFLGILVTMIGINWIVSDSTVASPHAYAV